MEFDLIEQYFKPLSQSTRPGDLAIGDDGAVIMPPADHQLVIVTDTLVSGVHFLADADPYDVGWKSLAVNLSDLAAMGAQPAFYSLALTLPEHNQAWLSAFTQGLKDCSAPFAMPLIGGDTTRGHLCITVTAQGWVPKGQALLRSGAQVGDDVYVSGYIGDASYGLALLTEKKSKESRVYSPQQQQAIARLLRPNARVELGRALRNIAHSAIDVSDGLMADLQHILVASKVGAELNFKQMPLREEVKSWAGAEYLKPLKAGDDYELCFTADSSQRATIQQIAESLDLKLQRIGSITPPPSSKDDASGLVIDGVTQAEQLGYQHF